VLSHCDTQHPLLIPSSVAECYEMAMDAFDIAEQLQTLVFVMSDLDLGMNTWMSDAFDYPTRPIGRGKLLTPEKLKELGSEWGRYRDVDGDGIPYRTIPGDGLPVYFARGSGHNERAVYSERPDDYQQNVDRLKRKFETAKSLVPGPELHDDAEAQIGLIAYGTSHWAVDESRQQLADEHGVRTAYLRVRGYPFADEVQRFIERFDRVYVVEQNRDGQLRSLLRLDLPPALATRYRSVLHYNGLPIDARSVTDDVLAQEGFEVAQKSTVRSVPGAGMTGGE
jgi:2-oxoglutarate/2-oxoacid ferredoxin oxidoreductase subunit alpha